MKMGIKFNRATGGYLEYCKKCGYPEGDRFKFEEMEDEVRAELNAEIAKEELGEEG